MMAAGLGSIKTIGLALWKVAAHGMVRAWAELVSGVSR